MCLWMMSKDGPGNQVEEGEERGCTDTGAFRGRSKGNRGCTDEGQASDTEIKKDAGEYACKDM